MEGLTKLAFLLTWVLLANGEEPDVSSGNIKTLARLLNDCGQQEDISICFKLKAVSFMDRLVRAPSTIPINEFVSIARDESAPPPEDNETHPVTEQELEQSLPRSMEEKGKRLDDLIWNKFHTLLSTRKIQLNLPSEYFEGRGKEKGGHKKGGHMHMMMAMMAGWAMKMMMGGVTMMASKAMIMSKIAMVLAMVMMLKKMGGGGEAHPPMVSYGPPEHGGGGGGYHRRQHDGQSLAYGSQSADY